MTGADHRDERREEGEDNGQRKKLDKRLRRDHASGCMNFLFGMLSQNLPQSVHAAKNIVPLEEHAVLKQSWRDMNTEMLHGARGKRKKNTMQQ